MRHHASWRWRNVLIWHQVGRINTDKENKQTTAPETLKRPNCWCWPAFITLDHAANRTEAMLGFECPVWMSQWRLWCHVTEKTSGTKDCGWFIPFKDTRILQNSFYLFSLWVLSILRFVINRFGVSSAASFLSLRARLTVWVSMATNHTSP